MVALWVSRWAVWKVCLKVLVKDETMVLVLATMKVVGWVQLLDRGWDEELGGRLARL